MEFFAIVFPVLVIAIIAIGTFFCVREMRDDVLAERLLVKQLSEDPTFLEQFASLIDHELSKTEHDAASEEIRRFDALIMGQIRQFDSSLRRFIAIMLDENARIARARNVLRLSRAARERAQVANLRWGLGVPVVPQDQTPVLRMSVLSTRRKS